MEGAKQFFGSTIDIFFTLVLHGIYYFLGVRSPSFNLAMALCCATAPQTKLNFVDLLRSPSNSPITFRSPHICHLRIIASGPVNSFPMRSELGGQASFYSFALCQVSVCAELTLGHLRYSFTDAPPPALRLAESAIRIRPQVN